MRKIAIRRSEQHFHRIVIPKVLRDQIGFENDLLVTMEIMEIDGKKGIFMRPTVNEDLPVNSTQYPVQNQRA